MNWIPSSAARRAVALGTTSLACASVLVWASVAQQPFRQLQPPARFFHPGGRGLESPPERPPAEPSSDTSPPCTRKAAVSDVYLHSGEFACSVVDLPIPGRGLDFVWSRKYRSRYGPDTDQGNGWDYSYDVRIEASGARILLHDGNSRTDAYLLQPNGTYTAPQFFREGRFDAGGSFTLTFADAGTWSFHALDGSPIAGKIESSSDRNGNTITFSYDGAGRLVAIVDTLGRTVTVAYDATGHIESVTDFAGRSVVYSYYGAGDPNGSPGDLKSVRSPVVVGTPNGNDFPSGKTTVYTYSTGSSDPRLNHNLLTITDPKGQTWLRNTWSSATSSASPDFDRVVRQVRGDSGDVLTFTYAPIPVVGVGSNPADSLCLRAIVNDRVGNVREYFYDRSNRFAMRRDYTGRAVPGVPTTETGNRPTNKLRASDPEFFETRYAYNADARVTQVVSPNGNVTLNVYQLDLDPASAWRSRGNLREVHRLPGTHVPAGDQPSLNEFFEYTGGFGSCCGISFVTKHTDARGDITLHDYDSFGNRIHTQHPIASVVEDFEYESYGRLTAHVLPANGTGGTGWRRRDEQAYYGPADGAQNGYLKTATVDAANLALTTTYEYDAVGNVVRVVDPRGADTLYAVNALNQVVRETSREVSPGGGVRYRVDRFYDANDNLVREDVENRDADGTIVVANPEWTTFYDYEVLNRRIRTTRERAPGSNVVTEVQYDANRNPTLYRSGQAVNGADSFNTRRILHDERDLVFRVIRAESSPLQSTEQRDYDGNRNETVRRKGLEAAPRITMHEYDGYDRRVRTTDAMGNVAELHYDANGNRGGDQSPGIPNPFAVRKSGELVDVPGSAGNVRLAEENRAYDALDRLVRADVAHFDTATQTPIGDGLSTTTTVYADASLVLAVTDDHGHTTNRSYDTANRLSIRVDPRGNSASYGYDANSNLVSVSEVDLSDLGNPPQSHLTTYAYDGLDRRVQAADSAGDMTSWSYDSRGNVLARTDPRGNVVLYEYDGLGRRVQTTREMTDTGDGSGTVVGAIVDTRAWDDSSRLTARTDDLGHTTAYSYDSFDRRTGTDYADCTAESLSFDVHDNVVSSTDANGSTVTTAFDLLDRPTSRSVSVGPGVFADTTLETYSYDGLSRRVRAQDDDSLETFGYDSLSNPLLESTQILSTGPVRTVASTYDGGSNRTRITYPGGRSIVTFYDVLERPVLERDDPPGPGATVATWMYDGADRLARRDHGNGTRLEMAYDAARRPIQTLHTLIASGTLIESRSYGWDPAGNKSFTDVPSSPPPDPRLYSYDSVNRLVRSDRPAAGCVVTYALDGAGNRLSVTGWEDPGPYTMDGTLCEPGDYQVNQYTTTPFDARGYDKNGNLTDTHSTPKFFHYDYRNRLVQYVDTGSGQTTSYRYDCFDRLLEKNIAGAVTRFYYAGGLELEEQSAANATLATYVWGSSAGELLQMKRGIQKYFYHADEQGSVAKITDATGNVVEQAKYHGDYGRASLFDASGTPLSVSAIGNPFLFQVLRFHGESALYRLASRIFDPRTGRCDQRQPGGAWIDEIALGNAYTFAGNNPLRSLPWVYSLDDASSVRDDDGTWMSSTATSQAAARCGPVTIQVEVEKILPAPFLDSVGKTPDEWSAERKRIRKERRQTMLDSWEKQAASDCKAACGKMDCGERIPGGIGPRRFEDFENECEYRGHTAVDGPWVYYWSTDPEKHPDKGLGDNWNVEPIWGHATGEARCDCACKYL